MRRMFIVPMLAMCLALLVPLGGCSNLTPSQTYKIDYGLYVAANVGLSAAVKTGKVPASEVPGIQAGLQTAAQKLAAGRAWIVLNPTLANTVGVYPPEFTAISAIMDVLQERLAKYTLIGPLPAPPPPPTPASTLVPTPNLIGP